MFKGGSIILEWHFIFKPAPSNRRFFNVKVNQEAGQVVFGMPDKDLETRVSWRQFPVKRISCSSRLVRFLARVFKARETSGRARIFSAASV